MTDNQKLCSYLEAVEGVREARNRLLESYNQLFLAYGAIDRASLDEFETFESAEEQIRLDVGDHLFNLFDASLAIEATTIHKFVRVGGKPYTASIKISKEDLGNGLAINDIVGVSFDFVSNEVKKI